MDFESEVKDETLSGFNSKILILILGLIALFILPSFTFVFLINIFVNVDTELLEFVAYILTYGGYLAVLFYLLKKEKTMKILKGFNLNNIKFAIIFSIILFFASIFTSSLCMIIFGDLSSNANQESLDIGMMKYPIIVSLFSVVFAPIVEELVFRFSIFKPIAEKNRVIAYLVSILFFAGIHFISSLSILMTNISEIGESLAYSIFFDDLKTLPVYIVAAFILTLSYDLNKNIATNIMIHSFYNLSQTVIMLLTLGVGSSDVVSSPVESLTSVRELICNFNFIENLLKIIGI